jgi:hypothetical protein
MGYPSIKSIMFIKSAQSVVITFAGLGLLFLGACSSGGNPASTASPAAVPKAAESAPAASPDKMAGDAMKSDDKQSDDKPGEKHGGQGGQVVEVGDYHLELVPEPEADLTHLDVFLQKGENHAAVPNAKITGQIQLPDGAQKTLAFQYDAAEKHYTAKLPGAAAGEYKVAILSDIKGEKINGRFSFKR